MIFKISTPFYAFSALIRSCYAKIAGYRVLTTPEEQEKRLDECYDCEFLVEDAESAQCGICTCLIEAKTMLCAEKCPKRRWKAIWEKKVVKTDRKSTLFKDVCR